MSVSTPSDRPATWAEYEALGEDPRFEYVDGHIIMTPFATPLHAYAIANLQNAIQPVMPSDLVVLSNAGWRTDGNEFGPDLMVVPRSTLEAVRFEGVPTLVVEVVSTNRARDLVLKVQKYARAGAPRYWILDLRDRTLLSLVLVDGTYEMAAQLDDDHPVADLETGAGAVRVSLPDLLS